MRSPSSFRVAGILALLSVPLVAQDDPLREAFKNPPDAARPRVWWHWMNGNISKEGIKLDLDWMHRVGIAGFQNFDAALQTPQVVEKRLAYMTPEWKDAFRYAIQLGDQYGMEMAIAGSPGWSESGGPWVPASHGMKKYVWSETAVEGGKPFAGTLAHPPTEHRTLSGPGPPWRAWTRACNAASAVLRRRRGRGLQGALGRVGAGRGAAEDHLQRRRPGRRRC